MLKFSGSRVILLHIIVLALILGGCDALSSSDNGGGERRPTLPSNVLPVDADATSEAAGTSWETAYSDLQVALDSAEAGDEVWVASGTYVPTEPRDSGDERTAAFEIPSGVSVYGGFSGDEQERQTRDPDANATVLSGDRGVEGESADNSYHVVVTDGADAETTLRGVIVEQGNANGDDLSRNVGGGLYNDEGRLTVRNVTFRDNRAVAAGGLYDTSGVTRLEAVTFENNQAFDGSGGGAVFDTDGQIQLRNVTFRQNEATIFGGGLYNLTNLTATAVVFEENLADGEEAGVGDGGGLNSAFGQLTIRNAEFIGNEANDAGGGAVVFETASKSERRTRSEDFGKSRDVDEPIEHRAGVERGPLYPENIPHTKEVSSGAKVASGPSLENVVFRGNRARRAGGLLNQRTDMVMDDAVFENNRAGGEGEAAEDGGGLLTFAGDGSVRNATFEENEAGDTGGGVHSVSATTTAVDVVFRENQANGSGGGLWAEGGEPMYVNTLFVNNSTGERGGGIGTLFSRLTLRGVTITQNSAQNGGHALFNTEGNRVVSPEVINCILWGNGNGTAGTEVATANGGQPRFVHSVVSGSGGSGSWDSSYGRDGGGNLDRDPEFVVGSPRLTSGSPAIDAGIGRYIATKHDDTDLDDNPRIVDGDGDGEEDMDLGAYEYQP
jgi:hypothetical protein